LRDFGRPWLQDRDFDNLGDAPWSSTQQNNSIREQNGFIQIMRDEQDRYVHVHPNLFQMHLHLRARLRVECAERFVHQQHARLVGQCASNGDTLLHAAGKLIWVGVGELVQPDQIDPFFGFFFGGLFGNSLLPQAKHDVFLTVSHGNSV